MDVIAFIERVRGEAAARVGIIAALAAVLAMAGVLRLDALTDRFGEVEGTTWIQAAQRSAHAIATALNHPAGTWSPEPEYPHADGPPTHYRSDPYTYLQRAREMRWFYGAHYREPVFPFVVRGWLWLVDGRDIAVSLASASFSLLAVLATFALGAMAFSPWVGGLAALAMAIERDAIAWGVAGWRDDAFTCAVALSVCAILAYRERPTMRRALLLGTAAGLACLTRIFAVTFLLPGFLYLLLRARAGWRLRWRGVAVAAGLATLIVLPYLVDCWRVYGDPFYTLNYQPLAYLDWEHADTSSPPGAAGYIVGKFREAPMETLDTAALGMTSYPFGNKWEGFDPWLPGLGRTIALAALAGLSLCLAFENGWLLVALAAAAQVPFAFTWRVSADWRYTAFTYPFFLIAAGLFFVLLAGMLRPSRWHVPQFDRRSRRMVAGWLLAMAGVAAVAWTIVRVLPALTFRERLMAGESAVIVAGARDGAFFRDGWADRIETPTVTTRAADASIATVDVPLPRAADYPVTLRMDPFPPPADDEPPRIVQILFNGTLVRTLHLTWDPERVGRYDLVIRHDLVKARDNQLTFLTGPAWTRGVPASDGTPRRFRLWYVLVRPPTAGDGGRG